MIGRKISAVLAITLAVAVLFAGRDATIWPWLIGDVSTSHVLLSALFIWFLMSAALIIVARRDTEALSADIHAILTAPLTALSSLILTDAFHVWASERSLSLETAQAGLVALLVVWHAPHYGFGRRARMHAPFLSAALLTFAGFSQTGEIPSWRVLLIPATFFVVVVGVSLAIDAIRAPNRNPRERQEFEWSQRRKHMKPIIFLGVVLCIFATLTFGMVGWLKQGRDPWDAFYLTLIAFSGDPIYASAPEMGNWQLRVARLTGFLATLAAVLTIVLGFLRDRIAMVRAARRTRHVVLIGASDFAQTEALQLAANDRRDVTIIDNPDALMKINTPPERFGKSLGIPANPDDPVQLARACGQSPEYAVFGTKDTVTNLVRARHFVRQYPDTSISLRIESDAVLRDLGLYAPELTRATVFSSARTVAKTWSHHSAITDLARIQRQDRVHVLIIGLGSVGVEVAVEAFMSFHSPDLLPLHLTVLDREPQRARHRFATEQPGMLAAMEAENRIEFVDFDGLQCANVGETSDRLEQIECKLRVTAIVVATGKDEVNATIAMRLRLLQRERLILKAPIFVRSDARRSVAPEAIDHLNAGIIYFGGRTRSRMDMRMSALFDDIGRAVHESWVKGQIMRGENPSKWVNMSAAQRQSSVRAAMFLPEIYRVMGLVPDANAAQASMRISSPVAQHLLDTVAGFTALHRTEHDRWRSEKAADGYKLAVGAQRDDEKKLHPSLAAFDLLPIDEQNKDLDVLKTIIDNAPKLNKAFALWPQWRKRVRVSVMGPIRGASPYLSELPTILEKLVADQSLPIECLSLEVLTPDAPGFDTEAATALLDSWRRLSNRPGDLLRLRILTKARLDTEAIAAKNLRHDAVEEANAALSRAARGRDRMIDLRPLGASDVDILSTSKTFADGIETANAHIIDLADICIFGGADRPQSHSSRAAKTAATKKKTIVTIDASGVAKVSPARQES